MAFSAEESSLACLIMHSDTARSIAPLVMDAPDTPCMFVDWKEMICAGGFSIATEPMPAVSLLVGEIFSILSAVKVTWTVTVPFIPIAEAE